MFSFSGSLNLINRWSRASVSEGTDQYISEERDGVLVMEDIREPEENVDNKIIPTEVTRTDSQVDDEMQAFEFLDKFNIKVYFMIRQLIYTVSLVVIS